jgi:hypothetical protein
MHPDGTLDHTVHRKPTHTDLYLQANLIIIWNKKGLSSTLFGHAKTICYSESLEGEMYQMRKRKGLEFHE